MKHDEQLLLMWVVLGWTLLGTVIAGCGAFAAWMLSRAALDIADRTAQLWRRYATTHSARHRFIDETLYADDPPLGSYREDASRGEARSIGEVEGS